ncbi:MAG: LPXTG cell wall anchor domain-containing protein, partial [Pseudolactococcus laudensis]
LIFNLLYLFSYVFRGALYTKNKSDVVNPEPNPDSNSDSKTGNQPIGKSDNQYQSKASVSSNQKQTLPETGETDSMTLMSVSLGLLLSAVTLLALALRLKQTQK